MCSSPPGSLPTDDAGWDALALETVTAQRAARRFVPGLGHHVHKQGDPRTPAVPDRGGGGAVRAAPVAVRAPSAGSTRRCWGRTLPLNGAGVCGAALADLGPAVELLRGFALLARTAG
jgi:citrate synthase